MGPHEDAEPPSIQARGFRVIYLPWSMWTIQKDNNTDFLKTLKLHSPARKKMDTKPSSTKIFCTKYIYKVATSEEKLVPS